MNRRYTIAASALILVLLAIVTFLSQRQNGLNLLPPGPSESPSPSQTPTPTATPIPAHEVYVANLGDHSILGFAIDANGQVATRPTRVIQGLSTGLHNPFDVVTDSGERIYVANLGDPPGTGSSVTVYSSTASGNAAPIRTLGLFRSPLLPSVQKATSVIIRPRPEAVLVADQPEPTPGQGQIMEFSTTVGQDDVIRIIRGNATELESPAGIGLDSLQRLHVIDTVRSRILVYRATPDVGRIDLPPEAIIEGPATGLNNPIDAALDSNGNIFVVNRGSLNPSVRDASITVYAAGAAGNAAPIRVLGSFGAPRVNLIDPVGIAIDSGGRIFLLQGGALKIFAADANGDPSPLQVISATFNNPGGIWVR
jgi:hypothetical protein